MWSNISKHDKSTTLDRGTFQLIVYKSWRGYSVLFFVVFLFFYMQIFNKTSLTELRRKSVLLTGYLEALVKQEYSRPEGKSVEEDGQEVYIDILTPSDPAQRGAQLSLAFNINVGQVFQELEKRGVVVSTEVACALQYRVGQWGRFEIHW